jgi:hypothetical protein
VWENRVNKRIQEPCYAAAMLRQPSVGHAFFFKTNVNLFFFVHSICLMKCFELHFEIF